VTMPTFFLDLSGIDIKVKATIDDDHAIEIESVYAFHGGKDVAHLFSEAAFDEMADLIRDQILYGENE
jgi:hypothetical protein